MENETNHELMKKVDQLTMNNILDAANCKMTCGVEEFSTSLSGQHTNLLRL